MGNLAAAVRGWWMLSSLKSEQTSLAGARAANEQRRGGSAWSGVAKIGGLGNYNITAYYLVERFPTAGQ